MDKKIITILLIKSSLISTNGSFPFQVYVWSRTFANAEKCAKEIKATACNTVQEAVKDADVIVTVTGSPTPVLKPEWVKPGAHINGKSNSGVLSLCILGNFAFFLLSAESFKVNC